MDSKERIDQLTDQLKEAGYRYYVLDDPTMEDYEYDRKLRRLEELETAYPELASPLSPTKRIGGEALSKFERCGTPCRWRACRMYFPRTRCANLTRICARAHREQLTASSRRWTGCPSRWNIRTAGSCAVRRAATGRWART